MSKKRVFSGVQPSGQLTIGNYIGAVKNFEKLQEEYDCIYSVVDLHSITVPKVAKELRQHTYEILATYLASGLDPEKSILFVQSHVPAHVELSWVLSTISSFGQLNRMTQFKEKSQKAEEVTAGLFTYPILMAADILLYDTDYVPVGDDQRQHLEFTRELAQRFNHRYSPTFTVPEGLITKQEEGGRIYSLQDPTSKMSKSDENPNSSIFLTDEPNVIRNKIKRAVTDSKNEFSYNDEQLGLKNLIEIYSAFSGESIDEVVQRYKGVSYGPFKEDLGEVIVKELEPFQEKYFSLLEDKKSLDKIMIDGAEKAQYLARRTLSKVYRKVGFVQPKR